MKTETIRTSNFENKSEQYLKLAKSLMDDAIDTANVTGHVIVIKISDEIISLFRALTASDCEYSIYSNCNAIEVWHNQIDEAF